MNPWIRRTRFFVVFVVLAIGVYDLVAVGFGGYDATISRFALDLPSAVVFAIGFAMGHMFWPQRKPDRRLEEEEE